jgi:hypothetical protein
MTGMEIPIEYSIEHGGPGASMNDSRAPIENLLNFFTL